MVKIVTDSSALFNPKQGEEINLKVIPLVVHINGNSYRDLDISAQEFMDLINQGHVPTSSQPPIGEVMEVYESFQGQEVLNICMADGLSGTYQSAVAAKDALADNAHVHVLNSRTLCGPQRHIVQKALALADTGLNATQIMEQLQTSVESAISFLIPYDFNFLKRGGRLTPVAATVGGLLKLKPVMYTIDEGRKIDKFTISRTLNGAIDSIVKYAKTHNFDETYKVYVSDADNQEAADQFVARFQKELPQIEVEMLKLGAAFITQGGPRALAIQFIKK
ncbi:MAG: DegV family protein [Erysipelotrichaceae bacterium]